MDVQLCHIYGQFREDNLERNISNNSAYLIIGSHRQAIIDLFLALILLFAQA